MDEFKFVSWTLEVDEPTKKSVTHQKKSHKKSRAGCQQCRNKRVKCDEIKPTCGACKRHKSSCIWGRTPDSQSTPPIDSGISKSYDFRTRPVHLATLSLEPPRLPELESKERRLSELKLLHHYMTKTSSSFNLPDSKSQIWDSLIPPVAFKNDSLLYSIYAVTSLHMSHLHPNEPEHFVTYQEYLGLCLHLHRDNVAMLSAENADAAMLTATLLRICSIAALQVRDVERDGEYVPPLEWLVMNFGTGHGLGVAAWKFLINEEDSVMRQMIGNDTPGLDPSKLLLRDDRVFARSNITPALSRLLERTALHEVDEPWEDEETRNAYEHTLAYIGSCQKAIDGAEPERSILRRVVLFPTVVERKFIALVEERRDRALVILAHYFSFWKRFDQFWWCGEVGVKEMRAICEAVDPRWKHLLPEEIESAMSSGFLDTFDDEGD